MDKMDGMSSTAEMSTWQLMRHACVIDPRQKFKPRWDLFITTLVLVTILAIPLQIAFDEDPPDGSFSDFSIALLVGDVFFLTDVGINLVTGFVNEANVLITSHNEIFRR